MKRKCHGQAGFLIFGHWEINPGLAGLDLLVNGFLDLQYSATGRWILVGAGAGSFLFYVMYLLLIDDSIIESIGAYSVPVTVAEIPAFIALIPLFGAVLSGVLGLFLP